MDNLANFIKSIGLLIMLLNPFLLIVYLVEIMEKFDFKKFASLLFRASFISLIVFIIFAIAGDFIFSTLLQTRFESLQIFGGIVLLIIGLHFVFKGTAAIEGLRGEPQHIAGSIAMPIMIGPGTISASMIAGNRLSSMLSVLAIATAILITITIMIALKCAHDFVKPRNEKLVERYIEIAGRITALVVGTYSIDMIMQGLKKWIQYIRQ